MLRTIHLPAPTAWPIVLAFGITLLFAGLVTNVAVSVLGLILAVPAAVGWFRNVLPIEAHVIVPLEAPDPTPPRKERASGAPTVVARRRSRQPS